MASIINSTTTSPGGLISTGDSDNSLLIQTGDTTAITINSSQVVSLTNPLPVASGGTGAATLTTNNVLLGNGTSALQAVAPGTAGNLLTSNGTTWQSTAPAGGGVTSLNGETGAITTTSIGSIGSVIVAYYGVTVTNASQSNTVTAGTTVSGSSLYYNVSPDATWGGASSGVLTFNGTYSGFSKGKSSSLVVGLAQNVTWSGGTALTGTWRCLSTVSTQYGSATTKSGPRSQAAWYDSLWVRVS
jgi:hypothetical protein